MPLRPSGVHRGTTYEAVPLASTDTLPPTAPTSVTVFTMEPPQVCPDPTHTPAWHVSTLQGNTIVTETAVGETLAGVGAGTSLAPEDGRCRRAGEPVGLGDMLRGALPEVASIGDIAPDDVVSLNGSWCWSGSHGSRPLPKT